MSTDDTAPIPLVRPVLANDKATFIWLAGALGAILLWSVFMLQPSGPLLLLAIFGPMAGTWIALWLHHGPLNLAERAAQEQSDFDIRTHYHIPSEELPSFIRNAVLTDQGEAVVGFYREHPISLAPWLWLATYAQPAALFAIVRAGHWQAMVVLWLIAMAIVGTQAWDWHRAVVVISSRRVFSVRGILTRHVDVMPNSKLTDLKFTTSFTSRTLARMRIIYLPYARFHLESAGQDQALNWLENVPGGFYIWRLISSVSLPPGHRDRSTQM